MESNDALVNKLGWRRESCESKAKCSLGINDSLLGEEELKQLPPFAPQAITHSLKTPQGFQVNPPVQRPKHRAAPPMTQRQPTQRQQEMENREGPLPVDDHRVWRGFISVPATFLVTTPAVEEKKTDKQQQRCKIRSQFRKWVFCLARAWIQIHHLLFPFIAWGGGGWLAGWPSPNRAPLCRNGEQHVAVFALLLNRELLGGGCTKKQEDHFHSFAFCLPLIVKLLYLERMQDATFNQCFCGALINYRLKSLHQSFTMCQCLHFEAATTLPLWVL